MTCNPYHLPLREILIPKKVQMPRDMVREATTVMNAVNPRPYFDFTRSILPVGAGTITVHMYLVYKVQYTTAKILP